MADWPACWAVPSYRQTTPPAARQETTGDSGHAGSACVLAINGGSSSIRFAVYATGAKLQCHLAGKIERIGRPRTQLIVSVADGAQPKPQRIAGGTPLAATQFLLKWLKAQPILPRVVAVGHRVVHGLEHAEPERVTARLLAELRRFTSYDPEHLPMEIGLIEAFRQRYPQLPQVACFDTAFHQTMPRVARLLPIPRRFLGHGIKRYGFHGISYAFLLGELGRIDPGAAGGRVIIAHLGHGASLVAMRAGQSIDTSMGFTPAGGLVMGTRAGDLDPGLLAYLARSERMTPARLSRMVHHESGLRGVSGTSSDLRDLLAREGRDARAAEAVALFCYQAKKGIGAYAAVLGGLDTLVFAGGIGENSPVIRERICAGLDFLGVKLSRLRNARSAARISPAAGPVTVRVIPTDEECMIARSVSRALGLGDPSP